MLPARWFNSTSSHVGLLYTSAQAENKSDVMMDLETVLYSLHNAANNHISNEISPITNERIVIKHINIEK